MLTAEIGRAGSYVEELRQFVHELDVPSAGRSRAAGACLAIAQEHHHAIVRLIEEKLFASSFALLRIEFEAYVRGEWLSLCANDSIVEAFLRGKEPSEIDCLLAELEMTIPSKRSCCPKSSRTLGTPCAPIRILVGYMYSVGIPRMESNRTILGMKFWKY